jgi:hypothetical protein
LELVEDFPSLEETILSWVSLIESIPTQARRNWDQMESRRLNIGIQAGNEPHAASFAISRKATSLLASAGFDVIFTVYAPPS